MPHSFPSAELLGVQEAVGLGLLLRQSGVRPDDLEARYLHPRHPCRVWVQVWLVKLNYRVTILRGKTSR